MLDTLLDIGEVLRKDNPIDTYIYFIETPRTNNEIGRKVQVWSVSVDEDFNFDIDAAKEVVGGVGKYFTFRFKTTEADNIFRYVCGDIYYSLRKKQDKQKNVIYEEKSAYRTKRQKVVAENSSDDEKKPILYRTEGSKDKSCFKNIGKNDMHLFSEGDSYSLISIGCRMRITDTRFISLQNNSFVNSRQTEV